jgi:hypothetical protein
MYLYMCVKVCNIPVITVRFRFTNCTFQTFLLVILELCKVLHYTFFRLSTFILFGSCKHFNLVSFFGLKILNIFLQIIVYLTAPTSNTNSHQLQFANNFYVLPRSIPVPTNIKFIQFYESL